VRTKIVNTTNNINIKNGKRKRKEENGEINEQGKKKIIVNLDDISSPEKDYEEITEDNKVNNNVIKKKRLGSRFKNGVNNFIKEKEELKQNIEREKKYLQQQKKIEKEKENKVETEKKEEKEKEKEKENRKTEIKEKLERQERNRKEAVKSIQERMKIEKENQEKEKKKKKKIRE
jgi:hypothetical protein